MMLKIDKCRYINTDYIVSLLIADSLIDNGSTIKARLIDNSQLDLFYGKGEEMENKLKEIIKDINIDNTKIIK